MSLLANLKTDSSIQEDKDVLGGGGILESNAYDLVVDLAYLDTSKGGAISFNLVLKGSNGESLKQTLWMTSGTAKGTKNYYEDSQGNKKYLPGFLQANNLCLLAVGKEISELEPEDKTIKLYDYEAKKEVPTSKQVLTELLNEPITVGVIKQTVDKNAKDSAGNYVPTGETREENEIDKMFRTSDKMTVAEIKAQADSSEFYEKWVEKNKGKTRNKAKGAEGNSGVPTASTGKAPEPTKSLFA